MNVFVTGGAGYIGSVCVEELLNAGHSVTVFDNLSEGHRSAVDPRASFVGGDFSDRSLIDSVVGQVKPEAVIHFAAHALVGESMTNPSKYFRNNVASGINLLDACVTHGVRKFVFSSTCATYGIPEKMPMDETLPQRPVNPYAELQAHVRADSLLVPRPPQLGVRGLPLLQRRRGQRPVW